MSTTNNNSIFFSSLDDVSLSPLKLSNLNSQGQTQPRSFPILLQPRPTLFSLLGSTQSCPRTSLIQELDFSYVSNTALKPYSERTSVVIDQAEQGFNRLSHTPHGSSGRSSFDADQSWPRMSPSEGYAQLPPIMFPDRELDQRASNIIPEHEINQQSNMQPRIQCLIQSYSQTEPASTTLLTFNQRLKQEQANKENESESKEFACSECDKIYKGKNARSILRRHLKDKHKIEQPRGTRWDNDPNRPKTDEERRQRMLESKRKSALKARERKNNQRVMMQQINNSQPGSQRSDLYSVSKAELSLILSPPRTPRNLCSSPVHYKIQ